MSKLNVETIENLSATKSIAVSKIQQSTSGTTASRPVASNVGDFYFDITIGKPIWWNGSVWKDATGTTV